MLKIAFCAPFVRHSDYFIILQLPKTMLGSLLCLFGFKQLFKRIDRRSVCLFHKVKIFICCSNVGVTQTLLHSFQICSVV